MQAHRERFATQQNNRLNQSGILPSTELRSRIFETSGMFETNNMAQKKKENLKFSYNQERLRPISKRPKRQQLYWIYKMVMNRRNFEYTFRNGMNYYLWKCRHARGCPCRSGKSVKELNAPKRDLQLKKARRRLIKELDIVRLINTMRDMQETRKVMF